MEVLNLFKSSITDKLMMRRYKIKIYPNDAQKEFIQSQFDLYRYVYNWTLETQIDSHKAGCGFISYYKMSKLVSEQRSYHKWLQKIPLHTCREAILKVQDAYKRFFSRKNGKPKFKKKRGAKRSFCMANDEASFYFTEKGVRIAGLGRKEFIDCKTHNIPIGEKYYEPTIIYDGKSYWLSVAIEKKDKSLFKSHDDLSDISIGIDLGIKTLAQLSNGKSYKKPNTKILENRRNRLQRQLRRRNGFKSWAITKPNDISKNEMKLRDKYYKTQDRINNINHSFMHNMTTEICNMYPKRIVMETFRQSHLLRTNRIFAKMHDGFSFYEITRQIKYKCYERGIEFIQVPANFPSSQLCSRCGNRYKVGSSRTYSCPCCGLIIDRDLNASINLANYQG